MPATKKILAFDLGAESGRGLLGQFDGERIRLDEVHRFPNGGVQTLDFIHWDVLRLYDEMIVTLLKTKAEHEHIDCLGVDTWGVDFALLGKDGSLLGNPRHYRDPHTNDILDQVFERMPKEDLYQKTGIQLMQFNSLFQLLAMKRDESPQLNVADHLLFIPDLFHYWFTGIKANEYTNASTSQMLDPTSRTWHRELIRELGLPDKMLGTIVSPGSELGPLRSALAQKTGLTSVPVIAPATHDTGSAVAAVPAGDKTWAFISSGTWSLMGAELDKPLIHEQVLQRNYTNEGGVNQTIRFLKNIMGLWLVQECRRVWAQEGTTYTYEKLVELAKAEPPFASLVNPDDSSFLLPAHMPNAIAEFCRKTKQKLPDSPGAVVRCSLESLAMRYRWVLEGLEKILEKRIETIHIVGGGCQNTLLCQFAADACNRPVIAGPVEATAIGNVMVQAIGLGLVSNLAEARHVIRNSFDVRTYEPQKPDDWNEPYERFLSYI